MDLGDTAQSQDNTTVLSWVLLPVRQGAGRNSGGGGGRGGARPQSLDFPLLEGDVTRRLFPPHLVTAAQQFPGDFSTLG